MFTPLTNLVFHEKLQNGSQLAVAIPNYYIVTGLYLNDSPFHVHKLPLEVKPMKKGILVVFMISLFLISCSKEGPMGPTGPAGETGAAGPGTKTTYTAQLVNLYSTGTYTLLCPEITTESSVVCYIQQSSLAPGINFVVPAVWTEFDSSVTYYSVAVSAGKVVFAWTNINDQVPPITGVVAVVVN